MRLLRRIAYWLRRSDRDLTDEIAFHRDLIERDLMQRGMAPAEAHDAARRAMGNETYIREESRHVWLWPSFEVIGQDVTYAARSYRRTPGFAVGVALTLALGIGATTTMYTIEHTVTRVSINVDDPASIVHIGQAAVDECLACGGIASGNYLTVRAQSRSLTDVTLVGPWNPILRGEQRTEIVNGARVTSTFFQLFGIRPMLGRVLAAGDTEPGFASVVVISETFWRTRLGGDSAVIGKTIVLDGVPHTVLGVVAREAVFPEGATVWTPYMLDAADRANHSSATDNAFGRLRPSVSFALARAEMATIGKRITTDHRAEMRDASLGIETFATWETPTSEDDLPLFVAVAMVLCVACVNLAGLLLARLTSRRREIAVRSAMGATSTRIARQLLTETTLVTLVSGVLGAAIAAGAVRIIRDAIPPFVADYLPHWHDMRLDWSALGIALGTGAFTGIGVGLWPALRFARPTLVEELKNATRGLTGAGAVSRMRRGLVAIEIAFAIVLLAAAGLLARSVHNIRAARIGFRSDHVLTLRVTPPPAIGVNAEVDSARWEGLAARFNGLPDVVHATPVLGMPYTHSAPTAEFEIDGVAASRLHQHSAQMVTAGADYFATLEIPIREGRAFRVTDRSNTTRVAIVDETVARQFFPNASPIGRLLVIDSTRWQIIGVAAVTRRGAHGVVSSSAPGEIYRPVLQHPGRAVQFAVRTRGDPLQSARDVMRVVGEFDRNLAVTNVSTLETVIANEGAPDRVLAGAMVGFALAAAAISMIGLYGIISNVVAQRMREFGIRRALGAEARSLVALVLGESGRVAVIGAALGLLGALATARVMSAVLVDVSPNDPVTLAGVVLLMVAVSAIASYLPARRASRVDPMLALRQE
jgi:predicted permease